jgi:hypothetical protein
MLFSFYDDQLYKIVVDYDARRTQGMTEADMVAAISSTYGVASISASKAARTATPYGQSDRPLTIWADNGYTVVLYRMSYQNAFRLVVSSAKLADQARVAELEAARLDRVEAPAREAERQRKQIDESRASEEEARRLNLPGFKP